MQWCATAVKQRKAIATKLKGSNMQHFSETKQLFMINYLEQLYKQS
jgi:hypothetical protein